MTRRRAESLLLGALALFFLFAFVRGGLLGVIDSKNLTIFGLLFMACAWGAWTRRLG